MHGHQEGRFFHSHYDGLRWLTLYLFSDRDLLAAKPRHPKIDAATGAIEEKIARIVHQICPALWPFGAYCPNFRAGDFFSDQVIALLVSPQGFEPWTPRLKVSCSTN